jgi:hypothetical protein
MNDPRMLNDPDRAKALEHIKEIHAARLPGDKGGRQQGRGILLAGI